MDLQWSFALGKGMAQEQNDEKPRSATALASDPKTSAEELRRLFHQSCFGPLAAIPWELEVHGTHHEVYEALAQNPGTPKDLVAILPAFIESADPNTDIEKLWALYDQATQEHIAHGLRRRISWNPSCSTHLFSHIADDAPFWYNAAAPYAGADLGSELSLWSILASQLDPNFKGDPFAPPRYFDAENPQFDGWLCGGLLPKPTFRGRTLWRSFCFLPADGRCRAFEAPRAWLAELYKELRRYRTTILMDLLAAGDDWSCVTRLVAPLCLEDLVGLRLTEPAQLVWKDEWPSAEVKRLLEDPKKDEPVVIDNVLGRYFPHTHTAEIYLKPVRALAARMARKRGYVPESDEHYELQELLCLLVEVHELAHGLSYRALDMAGRRFLEPDKASTVVHELWAEAVTALFAERYASLKDAQPLRALQDELSSTSPVPYRAYRLLDGLDAERVREALLQARQGQLPRPLGEMVPAVRELAEAYLAEAPPTAETKALQQVLRGLESAAVPGVDSMARLAAYEAFFTAVAGIAEVKEKAGERMPLARLMPLHGLAQLVVWHPEVDPFV